MSNDQDEMRDKLAGLVEKHKKLEKEVKGADIFLRQVSNSLVNIVEEIDKSITNLERKAENLEDKLSQQPSQAQAQQPSQAQAQQPSQAQAQQPSQAQQPEAEGASEEGPPRQGTRSRMLSQLKSALRDRKQKREKRK